MSEFVRVAKVTDIPDPGKQTVEVNDRLVLLVHVNGQFYCIDDVCTHDGGALGDGRLCGYEIACPRHGAKFDVRNGHVLTMPATENTGAHDVRVEGTDVLVRINE
jgi:3-phenylpropionate/trans-cinnamate dioxygenase ferredoxin subunit